jgi:hypothetical protein
MASVCWDPPLPVVSRGGRRLLNLQLASRIRRRISDDTPQRKLVSSSNDDPKEPKGLNLLFEPDYPLVHVRTNL